MKSVDSIKSHFYLSLSIYLKPFLPNEHHTFISYGAVRIDYAAFGGASILLMLE